MDLIEEYKAAERPDYISWGGSGIATVSPSSAVADSRSPSGSGSGISTA